jgi:hypothetical protein
MTLCEYCSDAVCREDLDLELSEPVENDDFRPFIENARPHHANFDALAKSALACQLCKSILDQFTRTYQKQYIDGKYKCPEWVSFTVRPHRRLLRWVDMRQYGILAKDVSVGPDRNDWNVVNSLMIQRETLRQIRQYSIEKRALCCTNIE